MSKGDVIVERGATLLEQLSRKVAAEGGFAAKLAEPLAEDADFLRKLKPSLVAARLRGEAPSDGHVAHTATSSPIPPPPDQKPSPTEKPRKPKSSKAGPSPIVVAVAAFALGIFAAKFIDWRGHAHPRD
jgi:hypothetical protein